MTVRVGINGFGRIGRNFFRAVKKSGADIDFVAANDLGSVETMAHLLQYDSVMGRYPGKVERRPTTASSSTATPSRSSPSATRRPCPGTTSASTWWSSRPASSPTATRPPPTSTPARRVVIVSAPATNADATFVVGVNDDTFDPAKHKVMSNASCTTNCFVPMIKVLDDAFGVEKGLMTTVHAYTGDQALVDGPHSDLRRARSAAINIMPASTGAARATGLVLESMKGKLDGTVAAGARCPTGRSPTSSAS